MSGDPFESPVKQKKYVKLALFGKGGTGKTRFALSFPKPCIVDSEKGSQPYVGRYDFKLKIANRWRQLEPIITWIRAHPGVYETLIIDSMTVFYLDLIQDIIDYIKNKRGNEVMTKGDWGVEKRRFAALLNIFTELPMNVILSFREKDEYLETTNKSGEEILKKTGEFLLDADKQTEYLFDIGLRCHTEEDKKKKTSKFLVTCTKTRYDWMPKYSVHDITSKRAFQELFATHVVEMLDAPDAPIVEPTEPILILPDPTPVERTADAIETVANADPETIKAAAESLAKPESESDTMETLNKLFSYPKPDPSKPEASLEDIKVLMTRWGKIVWPDPAKKCRDQSCQEQDHNHPSTTKAEGKSLLLAAYDVASSKELRKPQVDFLYNEFGKVLSGLAFMARDANGAVYIATPPGETEEEVRANVLKWE
jgi:hypothetical protein